MIDDNKYVIIGSRILQRRKQLHIKQSDLAQMIGVTKNHISNIENGKTQLSFSCFLQLCEALECNADFFISGIIQRDVEKNIVDMISLCTLEEQKIIYKLLDCYMHKND